MTPEGKTACDSCGNDGKSFGVDNAYVAKTVIFSENSLLHFIA